MRLDESGLSSLQEVERDPRRDDREVLEVKEYWSEAASFVAAHDWCVEITDQKLALSATPILCVFLISIVPVPPALSPLWVVTGDLPPAYFDTLETPTAMEALYDYCWTMSEWVSAVQSGYSVAELIPVRERGSFALVDANAETATLLEKRLNLIREHILQDARETDSE